MRVDKRLLAARACDESPDVEFTILGVAAGHTGIPDRGSLHQMGTCVRRLAGRSLGAGGGGVPDESDFAQALLALPREYDDRHGGFGGAPKFPPSRVVEFLGRPLSPETWQPWDRTSPRQPSRPDSWTPTCDEATGRRPGRSAGRAGAMAEQRCHSPAGPAARALSRRLAQAASPYLLRHADNPVDWWS